MPNFQHSHCLAVVFNMHYSKLKVNYSSKLSLSVYNTRVKGCDSPAGLLVHLQNDYETSTAGAPDSACETSTAGA